MACSKYTLTNTGSTIVNFNYRRCDDSLWEYQVELNPNQTKNIWLINGTFSIAPVYRDSINLINLGAFPPISQTATPTPTPSQTPTNTPTQTQTGTPTGTPTNTPTQTPTTTTTLTTTPTQTGTPTQTPTQTGTPTQTPTSLLQEFIVSSGTTDNVACNSMNTITLYAFNPLFDANTQFYNEPNGTVTIDLAGFYSDGASVTEIASNGSQVGSFILCSALATPTPTPTTTTTPTNTPTQTQTGTPTGTPTNTPTQTPTPTFGYYTYSLGYGASPGEACGASPSNVYAPVSGGTGPNIGETLYSDTILTTPVSDGYYSNGTAWYIVQGGAGLITVSDPNGC